MKPAYSFFLFSLFICYQNCKAQIVFTQKQVNSLTKKQIKTILENTDHNTVITFHNCTIKANNADFSNITSRADIRFNDVTFPSKVSFTGSTFSKAYFFNVKFKSGADFSYLTSDRVLSFKNSNFQDFISFKEIDLPDTLIFNKITLDSLRGKIDLTTCQLDSLKKQTCRINLNEVDISKFHILYSSFDLYFDKHDEKQQKFEHKSHLYSKLLENIKKSGYPPSYEKLDIEYKQLRYQRSQLGKIINIVQKLWWNYGYKKELVFFNTFILLSFFSIFNWIWFQTVQKQIYAIDSILTRYETIKNDFFEENNNTYRVSSNSKYTMQFRLFRFIALFCSVITITIGIALAIIERPFLYIVNYKKTEEQRQKPFKQSKYTLIRWLVYWKDTAFLAFFYTTFIFFNLIFSPNKLHLKGPFWVFRLFYFLTVYVVGLICAAHILSFIRDTLF